MTAKLDIPAEFVVAWAERTDRMPPTDQLVALAQRDGEDFDEFRARFILADGDDGPKCRAAWRQKLARDRKARPAKAVLVTVVISGKEIGARWAERDRYGRLVLVLEGDD